MGHRWRGGPRGSKRFSLCQRPRQSTAKPGSEADVFISLGCARLDTENVITQRSNLHLQPHSCRGRGGRTAACFSVVRSGSPGRARGAVSEQGRGPSQLPVSPVLLPGSPTGTGLRPPDLPCPDRVLSGAAGLRGLPGLPGTDAPAPEAGGVRQRHQDSVSFSWGAGGGLPSHQRGGNSFGAGTGQYCPCGSEFTLRFPATEETGAVGG